MMVLNIVLNNENKVEDGCELVMNHTLINMLLRTGKLLRHICFKKINFEKITFVNTMVVFLDSLTVEYPITSLNLSSIKISSKELKHLSKSFDKNPALNLKSLVLDFQMIGTDGWKILSNFIDKDNLISLSIRHSNEYSHKAK
ncbi:hypothetical protein F8M41_022708 [Gigaspora margarita]|uniref:Uncharacterized protein n=1 Tax=Gigaspora margarita TaxID=4874 RepID=A0A8H4AEN0_GIGMA|nr:hypothetical protein F8M41_022708 [Gigaspora margarita]